METTTELIYVDFKKRTVRSRWELNNEYLEAECLEWNESSMQHDQEIESLLEIYKHEVA